ncbi:uncharacterized protein B0T23DRAFT_433223 [Neurospora hispaniola]|uniref:Uncharacterized protein n=1 Tax=Neurospora hispaniola TaxID=588809 RepID=A0AAJ0MLS5_9PEZI|nr:hypothetical protein B0T23DRAFT_433223 [Neurospora hispaniola]
MSSVQFRTLGTPTGALQGSQQLQSPPPGVCAPPQISAASPKNAVPYPTLVRSTQSFSPSTAPADFYESYTDPAILPSWLQQQQKQA